MLGIFRQVIKERKYSLLIYSLAAVLFLWMYVGMFPSIQKQSENLMKLMEGYPESLKKAFDIETMDFTHLENFVAMEQFSFVWPLMLLFLLISLAGGAIAGEIEKGTIEVLLSNPVSRFQIFWGKYLAGIFSLLVFDFFSVFAIVPLAEGYHLEYKLPNFATIFLLGFIFGLAVFSLAMLFSVIFSDKGKVYFLSGGILVLMYVLKIIASLKENLSDLRYFSFFHYFDAPRALNHQEIDQWAFVVFLGVTLLSIVLALVILQKRDVAV